MMTRDERGSVLVVAMAMLTVVGLLIATLLGFTYSSTNAGVVIRDQGHRIYTADAGIERAIAGIRYDVELGRPPDEAPPPCPTFTLDGLNQRPVSVECVGLPNDDLGIPPNSPRNAILTLGQVDQHGIEQTSNNTLRVRGAVKSNSDISVNPGTLRVDGPIRARGACSANVINGDLGDRICDLGTTPPGAIDPRYPPEASSVPPAANLPNILCPLPAGPWLITLSPGTYTNPNALEQITGCRNKVVWFQPGIYHFNFTAAHTWTIDGNDVNVVAGTPLGWDPSSVTRPTIPFPGGCVPNQGLQADSAPGVQFIFSGESRLELRDGTTELCPIFHTNAQRISIYQKAAGSGGFARPTGCIVAQPYPGTAGSCALLKASGNDIRFLARGTLYAPSAVVDLRVTNESDQILGRGVISRMLKIHITGSVNPSGFAIQVPDATARDRKVEFRASVDGVERVRAVVVYEDLGGDTPGFRIRVTSWSVRR